MTMKNKLMLAGVMVVLQGCSSGANSPTAPIQQHDIQAKTYTFLNLTTSKSTTWTKARNYIASAFSEDRVTLQLEDREDGVLIAKGLVHWNMLDSPVSPSCYSNYEIRFVAKDNRARLQLELLPGIPAQSDCRKWSLPSGYGYQQINITFDALAHDLEDALHTKGKIEAMSDF